MGKRTGNPRGRPKGPEYTTLMARMPLTMAEQVKAYAQHTGQTVTKVLLDGVHHLLAPQAGSDSFLSDINRAGNILSDTQEAAPASRGATPGCDHILSDINAGDEQLSAVIARITETYYDYDPPDVLPLFAAASAHAQTIFLNDLQEAAVWITTVQHLLVTPPDTQHMADETCLSQSTGVPERDEILSDRNETVLDELLYDAKREEVAALLTDTSRPALDEILSDIKPAQDEILSDINTAPREHVSDNMPAFDAAKHRLGKLCKKGHAWGTSGLSLRANNKAGYCLTCNAALNKAKRQAAQA